MQRYLEKTTRTVDDATGQIVHEQTNVIRIAPLDPEPEYIKLYIHELARLRHLTPAYSEILLYVAATVDYQGFLSLTAHRKARIAASANCSVKTINNAISEYLKVGILQRVGRAEYELNPHLFAKGKWREIRERRKAFWTMTTYSEEGVTVESGEVTD